MKEKNEKKDRFVYNKLVLPKITANDKLETLIEKVTRAFELIQEHDHGEMKGELVKSSNVQIDKDINLGANKILNIGEVGFNNLSELSKSKNHSIKVVDGDFYIQIGEKNTIRLTQDGKLLNVGGIQGDYNQSKATISYDKETNSYYVRGDIPESTLVVDSIRTKEITTAVLNAKSGTQQMPLGSIIAIDTKLEGIMTIPEKGKVNQDGWMMCDGSPIPEGMKTKGNTPDLTEDRFLLGSIKKQSTYGGFNTIKILQKHLPEHKHSISILPKVTISNETHDHSCSIETNGNHNHQPNYVNTGFMGASKGEKIDITVSGGLSIDKPTIRSNQTSDSGSHSHTVKIGTATHSHKIDIESINTDTGLIGENQEIRTIPRYYGVIYLIKVN